MNIVELFESEETDRAARLEASMVHKQIENWLIKHQDEENFGLQSSTFRGLTAFLIPTHRRPYEQSNLHIVFISDDAPFKGSIGRARNGDIYIYVACLLRDGDTKYLDNRWVGRKNIFIHEYMHYLMRERNPNGEGSISRLNADGKAAYYNDPDETNAYYQEAAHRALAFIKSVVKEAPVVAYKWQTQRTVQDWVAYIKERFFDNNDFLKYATPETMRALDKRLARMVQETILPMLAKIEEPLSLR